MLSQQLCDLENDGMVLREVIPEKTPKTIYSLTSFGKSIIPVLEAVCNWGERYLERLDIQNACASSRKQCSLGDEIV